MTNNTTTPRPDVPAAVDIERPSSVPTSAEVKASLSPDEPMAGEITHLSSIASGDTVIKLARYDWPDSEPPVVVARVTIPSEGIDRFIHCADSVDPMMQWSRLSELASAASAAAQQLLAMITAGTWK